jgi:hypothetical protein
MDRFDYLRKVVPICYDPGHMGTFFMRVLYHQYIKNVTNEEVMEYHDHTPGFEWNAEDRISNYYGMTAKKRKKEFTKIYETLRHFCPDPDTFEKAVLHVLFQLTHNLHTPEKFIEKSSDVEWPDNLTEYEIVQLYKNDYDNQATVFPILKTHYASFTENQSLRNINFDKIVDVRFPDNKSWMAEVLLFYKRIYYPSIVNDKLKIIELVADFSDHYINRLRKILGKTDIIEKENNTYIKDWKEISSLNVITIDMYDLIFNKNVDQFKSISPLFDNYLDDSLFELLSMVEGHTRHICEHFDLDPNMDLDIRQPNVNLQPLKTPKLIEACQQVYDLYKGRVVYTGFNIQQ